MLRILIIGYVWPEPRSSAAGSHMLSLIKLCRSENWPLIFATPALETDHQADLAGLGVECRSITLNSDSFDAFVAEAQPDIVVFDRFMMEEQFGWRVARVCPQALRVLNTEDLHSLRQARQKQILALQRQIPQSGSGAFSEALAGIMSAPPEQLFQWMSGEELAYREIAAIHRCDLTLMISKFEQMLLIDHFGVAPENLHYYPLVLSLPDQPVRAFDQRCHFISIGNFRHGPNWDAVQWLKQNLWPGIRQRLPGADLHVYGAYPPPKATALHNKREGFLVKGWAADAGEVLAEARVCLAPLRFGAGIKGKLADAMLAGTPSVTTPIGAEGIAGANLWPGAVAKDPAGLVAAAVTLYTDSQAWTRAQEAGQTLLKDCFSHSVHGPALVARLAQASTNLTAHRQRNFIGAMLRHHSHQSSHYMGRWIEAKNHLQRMTQQ